MKRELIRKLMIGMAMAVLSGLLVSGPTTELGLAMNRGHPLGRFGQQAKTFLSQNRFGFSLVELKIFQSCVRTHISFADSIASSEAIRSVTHLDLTPATGKPVFAGIHPAFARPEII